MGHSQGGSIYGFVCRMYRMRSREMSAREDIACWVGER